MLSILKATIKVVKQVPKLAPIMIPKHCFWVIKFEDNSEIEIAVAPEDDCIAPDDKKPNKKLLNFEFTHFDIIDFSFDANK